eukprot:TRINITY_DN8615_c0_g1_i3.p1 TRINITY_DN8615_c0_g1~~TRINITY_DN8615_c0_g1_i3.p1  ORF type:complete len:386 (-),score=63.67 TRINITY_DN8615_c0_g1_i3:117-1274(-)
MYFARSLLVITFYPLVLLILNPCLSCSFFFFFLMIRRPPRSTLSSSSAASDVYKRQYQRRVRGTEMGCTSSTPGGDGAACSTFHPIPDRFHNITQVQQAVREAGLESSNLILGVDFTKSNTWTGRETFHNRSLHDTTSGMLNPYQRVIEVMGRTLEEFDDDKLIPCFGFGDSRTGDKQCFPFSHEPCNGFEEVLDRYAQIAPAVTLAGPTCFAPVIHEAIRIVQREQSYHILVIIADGQVDNTPTGATAQAIVEASKYPLSIIVVGVGDGPWGPMQEYDDCLPERRFDNLQFVEFNACLSTGMISPTSSERLEARFALAALMEIPDQYMFIKKSGMLSSRSAVTSTRPLMPVPHTPTAPPQQGSMGKGHRASAHDDPPRYAAGSA